VTDSYGLKPDSTINEILDAMQPHFSGDRSFIGMVFRAGVEAERARAAAETAGRRTLTLDIDTGEWIGDATIQGEDGVRLAASVLPGMPQEQIAAAYEVWMNEDFFWAARHGYGMTRAWTEAQALKLVEQYRAQARDENERTRPAVLRALHMPWEVQP
jgi:hypothetical protein